MGQLQVTFDPDPVGPVIGFPEIGAEMEPDQHATPTRQQDEGDAQDGEGLAMAHGQNWK